MRTGSRSGSNDGHSNNPEDEGDDYLLSIPAPAHTHTRPNSDDDSPIAMSPDEMLRQYAANRSANGGISTPPPSTPKPKGRKLSLRNGFGLGRKKNEKGIEGGLGVAPKGFLISYPVPSASPTGSSPTGLSPAGTSPTGTSPTGMSPTGMASPAVQAITEEPEEYEDDAYGGVH
jgi:hypothetical protein